MKTQLILTTAACAVLLTACAPSAETAPPPADVQNRAAPITLTGQDDAGSFAQGQAMLQARKDLIANPGKAKNVILFIGDGMGISTLTAARIYTGQKAGGPRRGLCPSHGNPALYGAGENLQHKPTSL